MAGKIEGYSSLLAACGKFDDVQWLIDRCFIHQGHEILPNGYHVGFRPENGAREDFHVQSVEEARALVRARRIRAIDPGKVALSRHFERLCDRTPIPEGAYHLPPVERVQLWWKRLKHTHRMEQEMGVV